MVSEKVVRKCSTSSTVMKTRRSPHQPGHYASLKSQQRVQQSAVAYSQHDHASPPGCRGTSGCLVSAAFSSEPWFSSEGNTRYMYANGRSRGHKDRWTSLRDFYVYITSTCKLYFGLENFTGQEIIYQIPLRLVFGVCTYLNRASPNFMLGLYTKYHRPTIKYYIQL